MCLIINAVEKNRPKRNCQHINILSKASSEVGPYIKHSLSHLSCVATGLMRCRLVQASQTVRCRYNAIHSLPNPHKRHPIAQPLALHIWYIWCPQNLIDILPQSFQWYMKYHVISDRVITVPTLCPIDTWTHRILRQLYRVGSLEDDITIVRVSLTSFIQPDYLCLASSQGQNMLRFVSSDLCSFFPLLCSIQNRSFFCVRVYAWPTILHTIQEYHLCNSINYIYINTPCEKRNWADMSLAHLGIVTPFADMILIQHWLK